MSPEKAWTTIEELAQYEEVGWNDLIFPKRRSLNHETANVEQVMKIMKCQVNSLMKDAISLVGKSKNLCMISSNKTWQLPVDPSHQEEFEGLVTNFVLDQEGKVYQLEEYMRVIGNDFMQLSLKVVEKLKDKIRIKESKKIHKITKFPNTKES
ncbi:hypothetical protein Tco_1402901 [Tanacetum coccineum]